MSPFIRRSYRYPQGEITGTLKPDFRVKNIKEGLTVTSFLLKWLLYIILMFVFMFMVSLVFVIILQWKPLMIIFLPSSMALFTAFFGPIVLGLLYFRDRKGYSLGDHFIGISVTAFLPIMGKVIMIEDIESIRKGKSYLIFGQFFGPDRRYFRNSFSPIFQDQVYVIDLKKDHQIVQNFNIMRRPEPKNRLQRYIMNWWYPDRIAVPMHVVDRYIGEGLKGYARLEEMLSHSTYKY
ncbi:MAG: hypothetical protein JXA22_03340 [Candidatus Thermoplasmatota archaeon]|nr:hypothetical protein [Candidatus Thermoplasmatota archaeon]